MKHLKRYGFKEYDQMIKDADRVANGIFYYIVMIGIFLGMIVGGCHIIAAIIDPCIAMIEHLAENALRLGIALAKIIVVGVFLIAIYQVFIKGV